MKITWNLRWLCAEKGIWTAADLGRRFRETLGLELSAQTLSTMLKQKPKNLSLNMLLAFCVTLDCNPNDLLVVDTSITGKSVRRLREQIMRVNQVRAPRHVRGGRRVRKAPQPPATRI